MANIGELVATLGVDTKGIDKAAKRVKFFESSTTRAFLKLGGIITGALSAKAFIQIADSMILVEGRLSLVTDSTEELISVQKELLDLSNDARVSFKSTADLYARLARSSDQLGVSQDQLLTVTEAISKSMIVSGASAIEANAAMIQLSQGMASGELRGEELRSVMEQTPRLARAMADGLGITIGKLREMGHAGELTSQIVIESLLSQADVIRDEFSKMPATVGQAMTILNNEIGFFVSGASKATSVTALMAQGIVSFARTVRAVAESGVMKAVWQNVVSGIELVKENVGLLITALKFLAVNFAVNRVIAFSNALKIATKSMTLLKVATMATTKAFKFLKRAALIGFLIEGIELVVKKWKKMNKLIKETPATWGAVGRIAADQFVNALNNSIIALSRGMNNILRLITDPMVSAFETVGDSIPDLLFGRKTFGEVANNIAKASSEAFSFALSRVGVDFSEDLNRRLIKIASDADLALLAKVSMEIEEPKAPRIPKPRAIPEISTTIAGIPDPQLARTQAANFQNIITELNDRLWGDNLSAADKFYNQQQMLDEKFNAALLLSGDARIKALQDVQNKSLELAEEVKDGNEVIIGSEEAIATAIGRVQMAQEAVVETQTQMKEGQLEWITALDQSAMNATQIIADLEGNIDNVDKKISSLIIEIDGSQAEVTVRNVKSIIDSIPEVTTKTIRIETITSGVSGGSIMPDVISGFSSDVPVFHNGTDFVQNTGPAILQKGEAVLTVDENKNRGQGDITAQFGDIIIQGMDKTPEEIAREIARPLQIELDNLNIITNR